jgi:hypothetical protein
MHWLFPRLELMAKFYYSNNLVHFRDNIEKQHELGITLSSTVTISFMMADAMFMFEVTAGIFVFLTAILFGSRAKRRSSQSRSDAEGHNKPEAA